MAATITLQQLMNIASKMDAETFLQKDSYAYGTVDPKFIASLGNYGPFLRRTEFYYMCYVVHTSAHVLQTTLP